MEGPDKEIKFTAQGKRGHPQQARRGREGFEKFLDGQIYTGTKRFGARWQRNR